MKADGCIKILSQKRINKKAHNCKEKSNNKIMLFATELKKLINYFKKIKFMH